jgi:XTP/dITP diphosphohydrolase
MDNALLKAQTLHEISGLPVLADDSGLSVPALGGAPGIYSARYGQEELGRSLSSTEQNDFLLKNMSAMEDRQAFFVCAMALFWEPYRFITAQEILKGEIASSPSGAGGFGYDPVFYLPEYKCCLAEISTEEKNEISHRGKAARVISSFLD